MYTIDEAFEILSKNKLTTHKETVRNWVRKGVIQAEPLESRKKGYRISEAALEQFIRERMPEGWEMYPESVTGDSRDVVKNEDEAPYHAEIDVEAIKEQGRIEMWNRVAGRWLWEGHLEITRTMIRNAIEHRGHSKEFGQFVWERYLKDSAPRKRPRVLYLVDAFLFEGERVPFDQDFGIKEEQIMHALIEHVRVKKRRGMYKNEADSR